MTTDNTKNELVVKLQEATDSADTKKIVDLFNVDIKKRELIRAAKYSELLDNVADQIEKRIKNVPDQFSNTDLLNYLTTLQTSINKSVDNTVDTLPAIQIVNNELNVNIVDRESKEKIKDALKKIIELQQTSAAEDTPYDIILEEQNEIL